MYYPASSERDYYRVLRAIARKLRDITKEQLYRVKESLREDEAIRCDETETERIIADIVSAFKTSGSIEEARTIIRRILNSVDKTIVENVRRAFKNCLGVDIFLDDSKLLEKVLSEWFAQQSQLTNSIVSTYTEKLQTIISNAVQRGSQFKEIQEEIEKLYSVTENRAKFIARNEVSNLNGIITRVRQTEVGIEAYEWSSSQDERVRPEHAFYNGKLFYWHSNVAGEINGVKVYPSPKYHPGMDYNCRCVAIPVIDFENWNPSSAVPMGEVKPNANTAVK